MGKLKRIISYVLVVALLLPLFIVSLPEITTSADNTDSNDRRSTFIKLAQGKNLTNFSADELDESTFRILTLYLSNFYELGITELFSIANGTSTDAVNETFKAALVAAGMDEKTAETLIPAIAKTCISTMSELYICTEDLGAYFYYVYTNNYYRFRASNITTSSWKDSSTNKLGSFAQIFNTGDLTALYNNPTRSDIYYTPWSLAGRNNIRVRSRLSVLGASFRYGFTYYSVPQSIRDLISVSGNTVSFNKGNVYGLASDWQHDFAKMNGLTDDSVITATVGGNDFSVKATPCSKSTAEGGEAASGVLEVSIKHKVGDSLSFVNVTYPLLISLLSDAEGLSDNIGSFKCTLCYYDKDSGKMFPAFNTHDSNLAALALNALEHSASSYNSLSSENKGNYLPLGQSIFRHTELNDSSAFVPLPDADSDETLKLFLSQDVMTTLSKYCIFYQPVYIDWAGSLYCCMMATQSVIPIIPASLNPRVVRHIKNETTHEAYCLDYYSRIADYGSNANGTRIYLNPERGMRFSDASDFRSKDLVDNDSSGEDIGDLIYWNSAVVAIQHTCEAIDPYFGTQDGYSTVDDGSDVASTDYLSGLWHGTAGSQTKDYWESVGEDAITNGTAGLTASLFSVCVNDYDNDKKIEAISGTGWFNPSGFFKPNDLVIIDDIAPINDTSDLSTIFKCASYSEYKNAFKNGSTTIIAGLFNKVDTTFCQRLFVSYAFYYWNGQEYYKSGKFDGTPLSGDAVAKDYFITYNTPYWHLMGMEEGIFKLDLQEFTQSLADDVNEQEAKTQSWIYYLLHPTAGFSYITTWVKNKVTAILLGWHEDMVGGSNSNSSTGMTAYLGFSGYTTTPSIGDLEWLSAVVDGYDSIVVYILIVLILILLCYIVVGSLTIARAVVGFFCFAFLCFLPPLMINSVVNISNETSMAIYTKKFNYWAIAQTEQYLGQLASVATTDESDPEYVQKLINMQALRDENTSQAAGYAGVRLKWMAAKKSNGGAVVKTLMKRSETYNSFADTQLARMVMNIYAQSSSAESFDFTDPYSLYLYRDQLDLYRVSAYSYNLYKEFNYGGILSQAKRYGISKATNIPEYVKWGSSFKWDYLSPTQAYSSSSVPTSLGLFEHKYAGDIYYIQAGNTTGFKGKETILGSRYKVTRSDIECRLTDDSWRRSFNMNNMIELAVLPITSGSSSGHASAGGQYISAESVYGVSDAADLPDIYTHFSPKMAEARGFLYRGDKYSKYGYLSNTTLATGYLLRYHQAVIESARQYYKYLEFANIGDEDGEDEIGASLGEGTGFAKRGIYAPEDGFNVESFFFNNNLFGFEPSNFYGSVQWIQGRGTNQYGYDVETISNGQVNTLKGLQTYSKRAVFNGTATQGTYDKDWRNAGAEDLILSYYYYGLYSESPFYYFNWNIRDQLNLSASGNIVQQEIEMDDDDTVESPLVSYNYLTTNALNKTQSLKDLWLGNDQAYFYNLFSAGYEGYGELRDFMNLRNFFYYVIPSMRWGTELVREWDRTYGCNYDTSKSSVKLDSDGSVLFNGNKIQDENGEWVASTKAPYKYKIEEIMCSPKYNAEEKYQIWHDVNVIRLYYCYSAWLDAMLDCDYAKEETIKIMGEEFIVEEPLNPYSYCRLDEDGNIIAGRSMVFSRSEMRFYGLNFNDLTTVEQKCITLQDNVYKETLDLMNYYTFSDEVLVQAYSLIQLFEFNKIFSQDGMFEENYILYPQGYELKAFSYDAYLRMILANATNTSVMAEASAEEGNSIYQRIAKKTSIFFGVFLILNDILAVYCVPLLKVAFIAIVFFISLALILSSAVKLELNMLTVILRSLLQPLGCFLLINIGFSFLVSLFIGSGADQVVNSQATIQLGDPTMTLIAMLIINILVTVLYFKLTKKCFADLKKYVTTLFSSIGTTVGGAATAFVGAFGAATAAGALAGSWGKSSNEKDRWLRGKKDGEGDGSGLKSTSPEQRGAANTTPEPGGSKSKASDTAPGTSTTNTDTSAVAKNKYDEKINEAKAKSEGSGTSTESSGGGKGGTKKGAHATSATFKKNGAMSNSGHASESGESKKSSQLDKMAEDVKRKGKKKPSKAERNAERFKANGGANTEKKEQDKANHKKYLSSKQQRELRNARKESKQGKHNKTSASKKGSATQSKPIGGNKVALNAAKSKNNLNKLGSNVSKASIPKPVSAGEKASRTKANKGKLTKRGESIKAKRKEASKEGSEKKEPVFGGNRFETNKSGSSSSTGNDSSANRKTLKQKFKKAKSALGDFNEELARKAHNARVVGRAVTKPIRVANTAVRATAAGVGAAANSLSKSVKAGLRTNNINLNDGNKSNS